MKKRYLFILLLVAVLFCPVAQARKITCFNEGWQFIKGPFANNIVSAQKQWKRKWNPVTLPHTWNARDMQEIERNFYEGEAYYRKEYFCPAALKGKRLYLKFEGVGSCAEVYVNGKLVGSHKGAYGAFVCEMGNALKYGENNIF